MVFGAEAVLLVPVDVAFRAPRIENYNEENSNQARLTELDSSEEERLTSCVRTAKYLDSVRWYYNCNINNRFFVVGDLVLRRKQKTEGLHKLSSHWEGPFMIKEVTQPDSYRLCDLDERDIPNSWHIEHLRRFYLEMY
jgi:hypothetical protein